MVNARCFSVFTFALCTVTLASATFVLPACTDKGDLFDRAYPACHAIRIPELGNFLSDLSNEERKATYLTPECKAVLEEIIPYDRESFKDHPWMIDRVNEGMQTLLGDYPLRLPAQSTIFGTSPAVGGAMPTDVARAIGSLSAYPEDLRRSIFNYILNQMDVVRLNYNAPGAAQSADLIPELEGRVMTVYKRFWDIDSPMSYLRDPFDLTGTLLHEARHGDGILHSLCLDSKFKKGFNCDATLAGPYGTSLFYFQSLIHGSGVCDNTNGKKCSPAVPHVIITKAGFRMCEVAKKRVRNIYPELANFLASKEEDLGEACDKMNYAKTMEFEGLPMGTDPEDAPPTPKQIKVLSTQDFVTDADT